MPSHAGETSENARLQALTASCIHARVFVLVFTYPNPQMLCRACMWSVSTCLCVMVCTTKHQNRSPPVGVKHQSNTLSVLKCSCACSKGGRRLPLSLVAKPTGKLTPAGQATITSILEGLGGNLVSIVASTPKRSSVPLIPVAAHLSAWRSHLLAFPAAEHLCAMLADAEQRCRLRVTTQVRFVNVVTS